MAEACREAVSGHEEIPHCCVENNCESEELLEVEGRCGGRGALGLESDEIQSEAGEVVDVGGVGHLGHLLPTIVSMY